MHYYLIVALQVFCFYHAYKTQRPYYWYFIIFFIPLLGSLVYIITQVFSRRDADTIQKEITSIINPTKKVKDLEKQLEFTESYANRIALADAYFEIGAYKNAIVNYESTFADKVQDATYARQQLVLCYFNLNAFESVVEHAEAIKNTSEFKGSKAQFCYGLALKELGRIQDAKTQLSAIDRPYSNYPERLELAKFYLDNDQISEGQQLLQDIFEESQHMTKPNKRLYRDTIAEVQRLLKSL